MYVCNHFTSLLVGNKTLSDRSAITVSHSLSLSLSLSLSFSFSDSHIAASCPTVANI